MQGTGSEVLGRALTDQPVDRLADQVRVTGVAGVLLDQIDHDAAQAGGAAVRPGPGREHIGTTRVVRREITEVVYRMPEEASNSR